MERAKGFEPSMSATANAKISAAAKAGWAAKKAGEEK
jgi:hypothetical protein